MTQYRLEYAARTDKGLVRGSNEDAFGTLPDEGMVVVADGMGGYSAGEVASQLAVDQVLRRLHKTVLPDDDVPIVSLAAQEAIEAANLAIWRATDEAPELRGMGTTVVVGLFRPSELVFAWVGDSRLYRMRGGRLTQLSRDHTLVQELVDQELFGSIDEAKEAGVGENVLTRALGAEGPVMVDGSSEAIAVGDLYLFCSDGLNHMVEDAAISSALSEAWDSLDDQADALLALAYAAGGADNITVVLAKVT